MVTTLKNDLRQACLAQQAQVPWGKLAAALRRFAVYRNARQVFIGPGAGLVQVRSNVLADGKELIMPGPGLKKGFYRLRPYSVPFGSLRHAVTYKGLARYGELVDHERVGDLAVELAVCDGLLFDGYGNRLGGGEGFFDLAMALLRRQQALAPQIQVYGLAGIEQIVARRLPTHSWDIQLDGLLTEQGVRQGWPVVRGAGAAKICWQALTQRQIRKMDPLFKIWQHRRRP